MTFLALTLTYAGFTSLSLAMDRHYRRIWQRPPARRASLMLRLLGTALLATAAAICVEVWGVSVGIVAWLGLLSATGLLLILLLTYVPRAAAGMALTAPAFALLAFAAG